MSSTPHPEDSSADVPLPDMGRAPTSVSMVRSEASKGRASRGSRDRSNPESFREDIPISDLKLLRRIGAGAYGEVWLAQTITGAYRAVKLVWREDFEFEKTFQREFEGIKQFEPISRGHRGLVNVLHVGRNEDARFYYCVMELADDSQNGQNIDVKAYVPRTLSSDFKRLGRLSVDVCKTIGIDLAEALGYMHSHGLTHRDIKPSNIIYVDGMCKLADIGLVAAHGERTFVGTEGFVPPEGPGTFSADIYSLGKVLYEISSGKDRMEFPEVPDDMAPEDLELWREWNSVICKACAPQLKDRYVSATDFANALRFVGLPKKIGFFRQSLRVLPRFLMGAVLTGTFLSILKTQYTWKMTVQGGGTVLLSPQERALEKLPRPERFWLNHVDMRFRWQRDHHLSDQPVTLELFNRFLDDSLRSFEGEVITLDHREDVSGQIVVVPQEDANEFCRWLTMQDRAQGTLNTEFEYRWRKYEPITRKPSASTDWQAICLEVVRIYYGQVHLTSNPSNVEVYVQNQMLGRTPLTLLRVREGAVNYELRLPGYTNTELKGVVKRNERLELSVDLKKSNLVTFGTTWRNSLDVEMAPLGQILMARKEVTRAQYEFFVSAIPNAEEPAINLRHDMQLPMTHVSREDAELYCKWLTQKERERGFIDNDMVYRLPSDDEWSMAANLPRERGLYPAERDGRVEGIYPWGFSWPPVRPEGNIWDRQAAKRAGQPAALENLNDQFAELAPGGMFDANRYGFYDLSGNVAEWVIDEFNGEGLRHQRLGTVRGGSWRSAKREELLSSHRTPLSIDAREDHVGFRIVLSRMGEWARPEEVLLPTIQN